MNPDRQLEKLNRVLEVLEDDKVSAKEAAEAFAMILDLFKELKDNLTKEVGDLDTRVENFESEVTSELGEKLKKHIEKVEKMGESLMRSQGTWSEKLRKEMLEEVGKVADLIPQMPDLSQIERRLTEVESRKIPEIPKDLVSEEKLLEQVETLKRELERVESLANKPAKVVNTRNDTWRNGQGKTMGTLTVSATAPLRPGLNDLWVDIS